MRVLQSATGKKPEDRRHSRLTPGVSGLIRTVCAVSVLVVMATSFADAQSLPLLVETHQLAEMLRNESGEIPVEAREDVRIIDFRGSWVRYRLGHIPQAVHLPHGVVHDKVDGVAGRLPPVDRVVEDLEKAGIGSETTIVIYDGVDGLWAARLFWALEYLGHDDVHILNGGIGKWKDDGYPTTLSGPDVGEADFTPHIRRNLMVSTTWMSENHDSAEHTLIDSRSPEEVSGRKSFSSRRGHIPTARNINWVRNLRDGENTPFLHIPELVELYRTEGLSKYDAVVTYCQTGVRSSHTYFALRVLGFRNVRVYDDSWEVWGNAKDLPIEPSEVS